jgi:hypothetical protein
MSVIVTAVPGEAMLSASQSHADGSTSAVPGSPFALAEVPQKLMAMGSHLLVEGASSISVFDVDRETGSLRQTDVLPASAMLRDAAVSPADSMIYLLDENAVSGFRMQAGRLISLPGSPFPVSLDETRQQRPTRLALNSSADSLFVAFSSNSAAASESFAVLTRSPDGSLSGLSAAVTDVPEEVQRAMSAADSAPGATGRIAAVINLQAAQ